MSAYVSKHGAAAADGGGAAADGKRKGLGMTSVHGRVVSMAELDQAEKKMTLDFVTC